MHDHTPAPPFLDTCRTSRTGRMSSALYCTASVLEFFGGGTLTVHLASHVAGHGWSAAWPGRIEGINDDGQIVEADGSERRIRWRADWESR